MKYAILLVMLLLIASKATATSTIRNELTICPTNRMASWDVTLPSEVSACLSVVVVRADSNYTLMKRRNQPPNQPNEYCTVLVPTRSQDFIWVYTLPGSSASGDIKGELRVGNTGATGARTVVTLACTWTKTSGGTGGGTAGAGTGTGTGGGPQELEGLITGTAMRTSSAVSWQFDRTVQAADGTRAITWTVSVCNPNGSLVPVTFTGLEQDSVSPAAQWTITPGTTLPTGSQATLTGTVKSSTPSTGKLKVTYTGAAGSPSTSETSLDFITIDIWSQYFWSCTHIAPVISNKTIQSSTPLTWSIIDDTTGETTVNQNGIIAPGPNPGGFTVKVTVTAAPDLFDTHRVTVLPPLQTTPGAIQDRGAPCGNLTDAEWALVQGNDTEAGIVWIAKQGAEKKADDFYGEHLSDGTPCNAFKHAYWNALIARALSAVTAKRWTDAHENWRGNPCCRCDGQSKMMDLNNNLMGISTARENPGRTPGELAIIIGATVDHGRAVTVPVTCP